MRQYATSNMRLRYTHIILYVALANCYIHIKNPDATATSGCAEGTRDTVGISNL